MIPLLEPEGDVYLAQLAMKLRALAASLDRPPRDPRDIVEELNGYADALDELAAEFPEMVNPIYLSPERRAEFQTDMTRIRREQLDQLWQKSSSRMPPDVTSSPSTTRGSVGVLLWLTAALANQWRRLTRSFAQR